MVLGGYIKGKRMAEEALFQHFPNSGVALRPGIVYGSRAITNSVTLPLNLLFGPVDLMLQRVDSKKLSGIPVVGGAFVPPVDVNKVGKVAMRAATDDSFPAGIVDPWQMQAMS